MCRVLSCRKNISLYSLWCSYYGLQSHSFLCCHKGINLKEYWQIKCQGIESRRPWSNITSQLSSAHGNQRGCHEKHHILVLLTLRTSSWLPARSMVSLPIVCNLNYCRDILPPFTSLSRHSPELPKMTSHRAPTPPAAPRLACSDGQHRLTTHSNEAYYTCLLHLVETSWPLPAAWWGFRL